MKMIIAIIKPHLLDEVRQALYQAGITGLTVTKVKGFGNQSGHTELYRGNEYVVDLQPRLKLEIGISAINVDKTVKAIRDTAYTGETGDGKIFVMNIEQVLRISNGETSNPAL